MQTMDARAHAGANGEARQGHSKKRQASAHTHPRKLGGGRFADEPAREKRGGERETGEFYFQEVFCAYLHGATAAERESGRGGEQRLRERASERERVKAREGRRGG